MRKQRGYLVGRLDVKIAVPKWASKMLFDFANTPSRQYFVQKWLWRELLPLSEEPEAFRKLQEIVRNIWRGTASGEYEVSRRLGLGKYGRERRYGLSPLNIDWKKSNLYFGASDLNEVLWFTLLHYSKDLGICANEKSERNPEGTCDTPYFLKYRPQQQFCSEICAGPAHREAKRRWWKEHRQASKDRADKKSDREKNKRGSKRRIKQ
jgi:hypothetical protein